MLMITNTNQMTSDYCMHAAAHSGYSNARIRCVGPRRGGRSADKFIANVVYAPRRLVGPTGRQVHALAVLHAAPL